MQTPKDNQQSHAMTLLNTSLIRKLIVFLAAALLSVSAMAADFNQTQRLANQGDALAQAMLGVMYSKGEGVPLDYSKAAQWIEKSANQGYVEAQARLGLMYTQGEGVRQDYTKARQWYEKAANQGSVEAQFILGWMYYKGEGVRQNYNTAKEWFGKACDNGYQKGCDFYRSFKEAGF